VTKKLKSEITQQDVDTLHKTFSDAMTSLFEKTKARHGCTPDQKLVIV
jgi:N-formylglutamate amidohydrolase